MAAFDLLPTFDYTASKRDRASSSSATSSTEGGNPELKRRSSVEEDCCSICLGPFTEKKCCTPPCTHIFHHECARGWLGEGKSALQDSCPLCKAPLLQGELLDRAKEVVNDDSQLREQLFGQAITQLGLHDMEEAMETRQQMTEDAERDLARASDRGGGSSAFVRDSDAIMQSIVSPRRTSVDAAAELPIRMPNPAQLRQQGSGDFRTIATLGRDRATTPPRRRARARTTATTPRTTSCRWRCPRMRGDGRSRRRRRGRFRRDGAPRNAAAAHRAGARVVLGTTITPLF